ncbi:GH1 family beta-glucosidase [Rhodovulum adriaticum]|uniref:Beta-glucosidase n=1 Tax=Rhodovulum adriaticum TaxID=35804 RepID=A0A4R2NMK6_RHOAD|nr:GH1 family beta-glucosidase [Rhodovulum adriaticum]MBK1636923.1 beta-glucosidase [Rhodovulum adriaticum]TCP22801.1 beta-glucosidase [Rhodovulum adriaticum]
MLPRRTDFPKGFLFGTATSAYQIEGYGTGGAGPTHWDSFAATPGNVAGAADGARACDHYHRFANDLDLVAGAGFDIYRFSTSWARVMPDGGTLNPQGLDFYDRLVDAMLARGLRPALTLYHWELPAALADRGGWANRDTAERFADFAAQIARRLGDRVWSWATINEPWCVSWLSHFEGHHAPGLRDIRATARAMHHVELAHGRALAALRAEGMDNCGVVLNFEPAQPATDSPATHAATDLFDAVMNRFFLGAMTRGEYPDTVLAGLGPHMPPGWAADMPAIAAPLDWLGVNYYTIKRIDAAPGPWPGWRIAPPQGATTDMGWEIAPDALTGLLDRIAAQTGDLPLYVTENGMAAPDTVQNGKVQDDDRIAYIAAHLRAARAAIDRGVPLRGYVVWSLMDNFEWAFGYGKRFGLVHVDVDTQRRTPKASWHALAQMLTGDGT